MAIVSQSSITGARNIKDAVGGFHLILKDGQPLLPPPNRLSRHPRSAAGISGRSLYLLVIDGRRSNSIGASETETAGILRALGSVDGINLDGGGSSALALRFPDGTVKVLNKPVHNGIPGNERAVAACLGVSVLPGENKVSE
jgi:exopolysaccharide biosynthesis protein